jgi:hypothetical protein
MSAQPPAQILRRALAAELRRDPRLFLMGEDIGAYGGAFGVTRGLLAEFGRRARPQHADRRVGLRGNGHRCRRGGHASGGGDHVHGLHHAGGRPAREHGGQAVTTSTAFQLPAGDPRGDGRRARLRRHPLAVPRASLLRRARHCKHRRSGVRRRRRRHCCKGAIADPNPVLFLEHKLLYPLRWEVPRRRREPVAPGRRGIARAKART